MKTFTQTLILISLLSIAFVAFGQKAYISGNTNLPVLDATNYGLIDDLTGFSSQLRWSANSPDGQYVYTGTVYFNPTLNLYKIDASTNEVVSSIPVPYAIQDIEITEDGQYLFHHNSTTVYKVNTDEFATVDSLNTGTLIQYIEPMNENTILAGGTERIFKLDFTNQSITDSVVFPTFNSPAELVVDQAAGKIYALKNSLPMTLWVVDLNTFTLESTISLSGMLGSVGDLILSEDGSTLYITSQGSTTLTGIIRVINTSDMGTIADIEKDYGSGAMSFAPNGMLWIPNNVSATITVLNPATNQIENVIDTEAYLNGPFSVAFGIGNTTSTHDINDVKEPKVFPNPYTRFITITGTTGNPSNNKVKILDTFGNVVFKQSLSSGNEISLSHIPAGIYFVHLSDNKKLFKLIKK